MDKCQIWYKGTSKHFVESICLIETAKTEVFFTSWKESSPKWSTFEVLEPSLLKIFSSIFLSLLKSVSRSFEKLRQ